MFNALNVRSCCYESAYTSAWNIYEVMRHIVLSSFMFNITFKHFINLPDMQNRLSCWIPTTKPGDFYNLPYRISSISNCRWHSRFLSFKKEKKSIEQGDALSRIFGEVVGRCGQKNLAKASHYFPITRGIFFIQSFRFLVLFRKLGVTPQHTYIHTHTHSPLYQEYNPTGRFRTCQYIKVYPSAHTCDIKTLLPRRLYHTTILITLQDHASFVRFSTNDVKSTLVPWFFFFSRREWKTPPSCSGHWVANDNKEKRERERKIGNWKQPKQWWC